MNTDHGCFYHHKFHLFVISVALLEIARTPYICFSCNLIGHRNCISLPPKIMITRHHHPISHSYTLHDQQNHPSEIWNCRIYHEDVNRVGRVIKHAYHDHNLVISSTSSTEDMKDDNNFYGCMWPISTPFYSCDECKFFLHKNCAELPIKKRHPFHKHLLTLTNLGDLFSGCTACSLSSHGFRRYICLEGCVFQILS